MVGTIPFLGVYMILFLWIFRFLFVFRRRISCMAGMMAAMAIGMTIGLGMGTLISMWLPDQFFQATILSMMIGGVIGAIAGAPISIMAVLDGLLAGIMGGMMGTMLLTMIPSENVESAIKIMMVLYGAITFLLFIMLQGEIKEEHLNKQSFLLTKPISMFVAIGLLFMITHQTAGISAGQWEDHSAHSQSISKDDLTPLKKTAEQSDVPIKTNLELLVKASEFSFSPVDIQLAVNEPFIITLENAGEVEHDFEIIGTDIHVHAIPGKSAKVTGNIAKAGTYEAVCTLPGHKEAGMISLVEVSSTST